MVQTTTISHSEVRTTQQIFKPFALTQHQRGLRPTVAEEVIADHIQAAEAVEVTIQKQPI